MYVLSNLSTYAIAKRITFAAEWKLLEICRPNRPRYVNLSFYVAYMVKKGLIVIIIQFWNVLVNALRNC